MRQLSHLLFAAAVSSVALVSATVVEDNRTHVGVYVNHISSCNFNHNTLEVICVNDARDALVQYNNVDSIAMCDYHFCVTFRSDTRKVVCSGYTWTHGSHEYNPLVTPAADTYGTLDAVPVNDWFLGYNIKVDSFVQNLASHYDGPVQSVICGPEPYSTCVTVNVNGTDVEACAGMLGVRLTDEVHSLILGINLLALISGLQYVPMRYLWSALRYSTVFNMIVVPTLSVVLGVLLLVASQNFVVKMAMFIIGAFLGVAAGYMLSEIALRLTRCDRGVTPGKQEGDTEAAPLRHEPEFVVEDDAAATTIELGELGEPGAITPSLDEVRRV
jgi:hypothetical protein